MEYESMGRVKSRLGRVFDFSIGGSFTFKRNIKYVTK